MADDRRVSGKIEVEQEGRFPSALKLMEKIASAEYDSMRGEQANRDYWLKLYSQCVHATHNILPEHLRDKR